jgi:hypothetical protein
VTGRRDNSAPGQGDEGLRWSADGSLPGIGDLGPVLRKVESRERVQGSRREGCQADEVRFVLGGEVARQPVGGLDEPVVLSIGPDQEDGEPSAYRWAVKRY